MSLLGPRTPQSVALLEQAPSELSSLSHPSSIEFAFLHAQKVQLGPAQLCINLLRSLGTAGPCSLTPGRGSKLIAVLLEANTITTGASALN